MAMPTARILIVEDTENNRVLITRQLQRKGYEVLTAQDAFAGLVLAKTRGPDLILMDIGLPGMDGYDATRRLKDDTATRTIPVIALTAHALRADEEASVAAGCDDFEVKPIDFARLLRKIGALLHQRRQAMPRQDKPID